MHQSTNVIVYVLCSASIKPLGLNQNCKQARLEGSYIYSDQSRGLSELPLTLRTSSDDWSRGSLALRRQKLRQLVSWPETGVRCFLCVCVLPNSSLIIHIVSDSELKSRKENLKPLPLTLQAGNVLHSSVCRATMDWGWDTSLKSHVYIQT